MSTSKGPAVTDSISSPADPIQPDDDLKITQQRSASIVSDQKSFAVGDILSLELVDPVLTSKIHLINNAIDEIGWTPYHWKLFVLAGFGYAVDSLIILLKSACLTAVTNEFNPSYPKGLVIASDIGLFLGAIFWGLSGDVIGRKWSFNVSLFICSIFGIAAGAAPNWIALTSCVAVLAFGGGGNLVLDTTVFLEYLPSNKQYVLTLLAAWWGVGQTIAGLFAWAFLPRYSCASVATCTKENNMGWRYVFYASCSLVFVMSVLRVTVIRLAETPKYLLGKGEDRAAAENLIAIAKKYNRPCSLTVEQLEACGVTEVRANHAKNKYSIAEIMVHFRGLFQTRKIGLSTTLIWLSWTLIGLAYPLFNVFLPTYLASRGAKFGVTSPFVTWRNYALVNFSSIWGPIIAGLLAATKLGRKYTMVIGALATMAFFFAYSQVKNNAENLGFSCAVNCCLNIYYGTLYAYTPEVLPSAHRSTGNGVAIACNRIMGIVSVVVATFANPNTAVPIYICAASYIVMAAIAVGFPFEPYGHRSS
ncbi:major facilitator superfamily domain-containing protein [Xylogone sp. PMI_703]|nr:major facilitator superfamily domain-containing protein [Xylogone sp. PMI_703]